MKTNSPTVRPKVVKSSAVLVSVTAVEVATRLMSALAHLKPTASIFAAAGGAASATRVSATVNVPATAVETVFRPLLAALAKPEANTSAPTLKPSSPLAAV